MIKKKSAKKSTAKSHYQHDRATKTLTLHPARTIQERIIKTEALNWDLPEEEREPLPYQTGTGSSNTTNWSEPEDRGEDLANINDPLMQGPERDTEIPPELIQKEPGAAPEVNENLADRFDAERGL